MKWLVGIARQGPTGLVEVRADEEWPTFGIGLSSMLVMVFNLAEREDAGVSVRRAPGWPPC